MKLRRREFWLRVPYVKPVRLVELSFNKADKLPRYGIQLPVHDSDAEIALHSLESAIKAGDLKGQPNASAAVQRYGEIAWTIAIDAYHRFYDKAAPDEKDLLAPVLAEWPRSIARRGRRPEFNWPEFDEEAERRYKNSTMNQAELERQMADWCSQKWPREPGHTMIRDHVSILYR